MLSRKNGRTRTPLRIREKWIKSLLQDLISDTNMIYLADYSIVTLKRTPTVTIHRSVTILKNDVRNGVLSHSARHFERSSNLFAGDSRPFRKLTESPLTFCSNSCSIIFTGFGHPVKILLSQVHHTAWVCDLLTK